MSRDIRSSTRVHIGSDQEEKSQLVAQKRWSEQSLVEKEREKVRKEREADAMEGGGMEQRLWETIRSDMENRISGLVTSCGMLCMRVN